MIMPSDEWRSADQSEIVLAFQVSATGEPVIPSRGHHVFAYLPVQRLSHLPVCRLRHGAVRS